MIHHRLTFSLAPPTGPRGHARWSSSWRTQGVGVLRMGFGLIWSIDAWFKWQPGFVDNLAGYLKADGQPPAVAAWITFWLHVVRANPHLFAYLQAGAETALALFLLLGAFSNLTCCIGFLLSLFIWSAPEGFGGPYTPGATDIGTGIIYALVFAGLFLVGGGLALSVDSRLTPILGRWGFLASGSLLAGMTGRGRHIRPAPVLLLSGKSNEKPLVHLRLRRRSLRLGI